MGIAYQKDVRVPTANIYLEISCSVCIAKYTCMRLMYEGFSPFSNFRSFVCCWYAQRLIIWGLSALGLVHTHQGYTHHAFCSIAFLSYAACIVHIPLRRYCSGINSDSASPSRPSSPLSTPVCALLTSRDDLFRLSPRQLYPNGAITQAKYRPSTQLNAFTTVGVCNTAIPSI